MEAQKLKTELDQLRIDLANAQRRGEYQRAGELAYSRIPEIENKLKAVEEAEAEAKGAMVEEAVTANHVAQVIARTTGVTVGQVLSTGSAGQTPNKNKSTSTFGRIFVSYRRNDSAGHAGRVHDRLNAEFGPDLLFMDVTTIPLGVNFVDVLHEAVGQCEVFLALIGPNWLDARDDVGNRRLEDPNDFVRIEIAAALNRTIPVIPILLGGTGALSRDLLPKDLEELAQRNWLEVRHNSFHADMDKLIRELKSLLKSARRRLMSG